MNCTEFFTKYDGKGIDFDGYYGFQCMDLFEQYHKEVIGGNPVYGNAVDMWVKYPKDLYTQIGNQSNNFPQLGDVIVWGTGLGPYGHIAVCKEANTNTFVSFDQNWPVGSLCHFQNHNFNNVLGWLRPKVSVTPPPPTPVDPDKVKIHIGVNPKNNHDWGDMETQAVRSVVFDQENTIEASHATPPPNDPSMPPTQPPASSQTSWLERLLAWLKQH